MPLIQLALALGVTALAAAVVAATAPVPAAAQESASLETVDEAHAAQADWFGELVGGIDRLFGEQYVEDRDRKIQVRAGGETTFNDDGESIDTALVLALRFPLPALERRYNLFFEVGEDIRELGAASDPNFDEARRRLSVAAALLARPREELETGLKLTAFWAEDSFASLFPFVRFERKRPPMRYFFEQRVIWESGNVWKTRTDLDVDRALGTAMFLRLHNRVDYVEGEPGAHAAHGLNLRQIAFARSGISYEVWLEYGSAHDAPDTPDDDTIAYAQVRWRGRVWRRWLEYELRPAYTWVLGNDRDPFYSFFVSLTVVWDSHIGGSGGHPVEKYR